MVWFYIALVLATQYVLRCGLLPPQWTYGW
jgi:hypothetical protein